MGGEQGRRAAQLAVPSWARTAVSHAGSAMLHYTVALVWTQGQMLALGRHRTVLPSGASLSSRERGDTVASAGGTWAGILPIEQGWLRLC